MHCINISAICFDHITFIDALCLQICRRKFSDAFCLCCCTIRYSHIHAYTGLILHFGTRFHILLAFFLHAFFFFQNVIDFTIIRSQCVHFPYFFHRLFTSRIHLRRFHLILVCVLLCLPKSVFYGIFP